MVSKEEYIYIYIFFQKVYSKDEKCVTAIYMIKN